MDPQKSPLWSLGNPTDKVSLTTGQAQRLGQGGQCVLDPRRSPALCGEVGRGQGLGGGCEA